VTLLPATLERDLYAGFLETTQGDCFRLVVRLTENGRVDPGALEVDPELKLLLQPFLKALLARAAHSPDLRGFAAELVDLVDQAVLVDARRDAELAVLAPCSLPAL
jgi:hypothetical protein